jgi:hypothetical protein
MVTFIGSERRPDSHACYVRHCQSGVLVQLGANGLPALNFAVESSKPFHRHGGVGCDRRQVSDQARLGETLAGNDERKCRAGLGTTYLRLCLEQRDMQPHRVCVEAMRWRLSGSTRAASS